MRDYMSGILYQAIFPVLDNWLQQPPELKFMQDGAPGHRGKITQAEIEKHKMPKTPWPPYSPDPKPIETLWDWMKDYIQDNFLEKMGYAQLRKAVQDAWDSITVDQLCEVMDTMHDRCQAVIDANARQIPY